MAQLPLPNVQVELPDPDMPELEDPLDEAARVALEQQAMIQADQGAHCIIKIPYPSSLQALGAPSFQRMVVDRNNYLPTGIVPLPPYPCPSGKD